ncbi:hypothetical protein [Aquabacter cavernae]|uniref:hypothetical protein n=1 Tax=Aquabacter cavernae TaxID=2496029 RepID=UPI000F8E4C9B|nr:hypothetical protein [Aquabacter cavernae]
MASISLLVVFLALAIFVGSWGVAVYEGTRAEEGLGALGPVRRGFLLFWPFAARGRQDPANAHGRRAGKAQIAVIASLMVAVAAASAYTNLTHERPGKAASADLTAPSQS